MSRSDLGFTFKSLLPTAARSFMPASVPWITRANYRRELLAAFFLPFMLAVFQGGVISVFAKIAFEGTVNKGLLNYAVGFLSAVPALTNVTSFVWVRLSHGHHKIRFIKAMEWTIAAMIIVVAFVPKSSLGLVVLIAAATIAQSCWTGVVTVRSTVWSVNYPRKVRARITGKFAAVQVSLIAYLSLALGAILDKDQASFRILLPIAAALSLVAIFAAGRVRVRRHRRVIQDELDGSGPDGPTLNPLRLMRVLIEDRRFGAYMLCQFLLGIGNIMASAVLSIVLVEKFDTGYLDGILLSSSLPLCLMPLAIPLWSRVLDHWHVARFRAVHSWVFVASLLFLFVGTWRGALWCIYASAVLRGFGFAGGAIAWNLGHLDFAPPGRASEYMGIHVTLTGVRGIISAAIGVGAYEMLEAWKTGGGALVFLLCVMLAVLGAVGFMLLSRAIQREHKPTPRRELEVAPPSRTGV